MTVGVSSYYGFLTPSQGATDPEKQSAQTSEISHGFTISREIGPKTSKVFVGSRLPVLESPLRRLDNHYHRITYIGL